MPGKRITDLTALSGAGSANNDDLVIFDTTANETKRISRSQLAEGMQADVQVLSNKTLALGSNTVTGTTAQFNTALTDNNFATQAGSEVLTNKTIDSANNTLTINYKEAQVETSNGSRTHLFTTVAALLADTGTYTTYAAGQIVEAGGFRYAVAATGATDHHVTTAGGTKLYVQAGDAGYNVKAFGAVGDWNGTDSFAGTGTDDTAAIQAAVNAAVANGSPLTFPNGRYRTTAAIVIDRTGNIEDPINGGMFGGTLVGGGPASCQVVADHNGKALDFRGGAGAGWHTYLNIDGIGLLKANYARNAGSVGLAMDQAAYFSVRRFDMYGFEYGIDGTDCLSGSFEDGTIRGNKYGFRFQRGSRSYPNNISFRGVMTLNNITYGGALYRPAVFSYIGGSIESNGYTGIVADPNSWGLYVESAGTEGSVGINMQGVYIENNNGIADVSILQTVNNVIHNFNGCSFLRFLDTRYVTQNILFNSTNESRISLSGCGFKEFAPYVSSSSRLFVAAGEAKVIDGGGNIFLDTANGNTPIQRSVFAPLGVNHQLPFDALPDVVKYRNGIQYCSDGTGSLLPSLAVSDGTKWWQIPLGVFAGRVSSAGAALKLPRGWSCSRNSAGVYTITHNLSLAANTHAVTATPSGGPGAAQCSGVALSGNTFEIYFTNSAGTLTDAAFNFTLTVI